MARGDQRQIIAVGHLPNKIFALLFAVAEILGGFIAAAYKGIFSVVTYSRLLLRKDNYYKIIIKRNQNRRTTLQVNSPDLHGRYNPRFFFGCAANFFDTSGTLRGCGVIS